MQAWLGSHGQLSACLCLIPSRAGWVHRVHDGCARRSLGGCQAAAGKQGRRQRPELGEPQTRVPVQHLSVLGDFLVLGFSPKLLRFFPCHQAHASAGSACWCNSGLDRAVSSHFIRPASPMRVTEQYLPTPDKGTGSCGGGGGWGGSALLSQDLYQGPNVVWPNVESLRQCMCVFVCVGSGGRISARCYVALTAQCALRVRK